MVEASETRMKRGREGGRTWEMSGRGRTGRVGKE